MTEITFLLEAEEELNYSAQYYNQQASGLGFDFLEEIEKSLQETARAPERWSHYKKNIRKFKFVFAPSSVVKSRDNLR